MSHQANKGFWNRNEFKVILGYLVGSWTLLEFTSFSLERLNISSLWSEIFLKAVLWFIPSILIIALVPAKSKFFRVLRRVFPLVNILAIGGILVFSFWGRELGTMTEVVSYTDQDGKDVSKTVLKSEFVTRIMVSPFQNKSENSSELEWVGKGISEAFELNLGQHHFVDIQHSSANSTKVELVDLLKRYCDYLVEGDYEFKNDSLFLDYKIYNKSYKLVTNGRIGAKNLFDASDQLKKISLNELDLRFDRERTIDLPFEDFVTKSEKAFAHFVNRRYNKAIEEDPLFAYAYLEELRNVHYSTGGDLYLKKLAQQAIEVGNTLPESDQLLLQVYYFMAVDNKEKAKQAFGNFASLFPGNPNVQENHILFLSRNGFSEEALNLALADFEKKLIRSNTSFLMRALLQEKGEADKLEEQVRKVENLISKKDFQMTMGEIELLRGNYSKARTYYENVHLIDPLNKVIDSLIKVTHFMESVPQDSIKKWNASFIGEYLPDQIDQVLTFREVDGRMVFRPVNQAPSVMYYIGPERIYEGDAFSPTKYQHVTTLKRNEFNEVIKFRDVIYRANREPFESHGFRLVPGLYEGISAFRRGDFSTADSLLSNIWNRDSSYYYLKSYLDAIANIDQDKTRSMMELLDGKAFQFENEKHLEYSLKFVVEEDQLLIVPYEGGIRLAYHLGDGWILNELRRNQKYRLIEGDELSLEIYLYNHHSGEYDFVLNAYEVLNE